MQNLSEIRQQRQMFQDQIRQMRVKINSHLDTLEHNILQELDDTEDTIKSKINYLTDRKKPNTIFVVCRNTIWTAGSIMELTEKCVFHIMMLTIIIDF
jgi:gas vesicle protein